MIQINKHNISTIIVIMLSQNVDVKIKLCVLQYIIFPCSVF